MGHPVDSGPAACVATRRVLPEVHGCFACTAIPDDQGICGFTFVDYFPATLDIRVELDGALMYEDTLIADYGTDPSCVTWYPVLPLP